MKQIIEEVLFSKEREMLAWIKYAPHDDQYKLTADYGEMVGIGPVSYTHLDVYKRQDSDRAI